MQYSDSCIFLSLSKNLILRKIHASPFFYHLYNHACRLNTHSGHVYERGFNGKIITHTLFLQDGGGSRYTYTVIRETLKSHTIEQTNVCFLTKTKT